MGKWRVEREREKKNETKKYRLGRDNGKLQAEHAKQELTARKGRDAFIESKLGAKALDIFIDLLQYFIVFEERIPTGKKMRAGVIWEI